LRQTRPRTAVLYMSGYTDDAITRHGLLDAEIQLIVKPFTVDVLCAKVRDVLDRARGGRAPAASVAAATSEVAGPPDGAGTRALPTQLVDKLRQAVAAARYDDIVALLDEVERVDRATATSLRQSLDSFDYQGLVTALAGAKTEG
jgi:hypothetical protein